MAIVGGGESEAITSRLGRCVAILERYHPSSSETILASRSQERGNSCPKVFPAKLHPNAKIFTIKTDNSNIAIRNNVDSWAKDEEGHLFFSLRTNGSIDAADVLREC